MSKANYLNILSLPICELKPENLALEDFLLVRSPGLGVLTRGQSKLSGGSEGRSQQVAGNGHDVVLWLDAVDNCGSWQLIISGKLRRWCCVAIGSNERWRRMIQRNGRRQRIMISSDKVDVGWWHLVGRRLRSLLVISIMSSATHHHRVLLINYYSMTKILHHHGRFNIQSDLCDKLLI